MKICLVNPPIEDFYYTSVRRQPLGLLYIAAALQKAGHSVELLNCHSAKKSRMPIPEKFAYLEKYMTAQNTEYSFPFRDYTHYGTSFQEIEQRIKKSEAALFMVSSMFTTYHEECEKIIEFIKKHRPHALIAAGGYHASLHSDHFLKNIDIDFVLRGEGEDSSCMLAEAVESGSGFDKIPGCSYMDGNTVTNNNRAYNTDIDTFEVPARKILPQSHFKFYKKRMTPIITSRGCPNSCSFCTGKIVWGTSYRMRSAASVIDEIDRCVSDLGITCFNFEDDNLFPTAGRAVEILDVLINFQKQKGITLEFTAMNGTSIEHLDSEIIGLMKKAGFNEINISLVTHSENIQESEKRPFSTEHFGKIINSAGKTGMNTRTYFILGLPGQTRCEIQETVDYLKKNSVSFFPSVYYNVFSPQKEWKCQRSSAFFNETAGLSRDDLVYFFNKCRSMQH